MNDTIFALSSGSIPSGVAVIRVSGPASKSVVETLGCEVPAARNMILGRLLDPISGELLDKALILYFRSPNSFTGEDVIELHTHGGRAVVSCILETLSKMDGLRLAEAGEFSRRAFENGKLDLTEIEGLSDLIAADTEAQRKQAVAQAEGKLRYKLESWRSAIIRCRAYLEAEFDFSEEEDVPDTMESNIRQTVNQLVAEINRVLEDGGKGEIIRDGLNVVLSGPPNAGKSSLINALAGRDIAIVSEEAGTTRDVLQCAIDIDGHLVNISDTAGIRASESMVEQEGVRRARSTADRADILIWLSPVNEPKRPESGFENAVVFRSKADLAKVDGSSLWVSTKREDGLLPLLDLLKRELHKVNTTGEESIITRERHRVALTETHHYLLESLGFLEKNPELAAEQLRFASDHIGRLSGHVGVEDLLDVIFREFCVGK